MISLWNGILNNNDSKQAIAIMQTGTNPRDKQLSMKNEIQMYTQHMIPFL